MLLLSPQKRPEPLCSGQWSDQRCPPPPEGTAASGRDGRLPGRSWGNLLPVASVINSEFQWDKVKELKKEICLFGMENHFKRKKN